MRSLRLTPTELAAPHSPLGLSESALAPLLPPIPVLSPPQILPHPATAHRLSSPRVWAPVLPLNRAALTNYRSICPTFHLKILTYRNCERIINCTTFHLDSAIVNILPCLSVCLRAISSLVLCPSSSDLGAKLSSRPCCPSPEVPISQQNQLHGKRHKQPAQSPPVS